VKKVYKSGIVGYGYMGEIRRRVIENNPRLALMGIVETDQEKLKTISDCRTFVSFADLLKEDIDIVFVCTPNSYSPQICIESMNRGKHVFCEKPPGRSLADIKNIKEAENSKAKLMFGFNHRFHPGVIKAKIIVDSGRFGKIIGVKGVYGKSGGVNFSNSWRNDKDISGGGILLDQGIHMLDLFRYFCGDFEYVKSFASDFFWKFGVEDNAYVILQNRENQMAFLHSSATLWKHTFKIDIIMEHGYLVVEGFLSKTGSYGRERLTVAKRQFEDEVSALGNPAEETTYFDKDISWELEVDNFVKAIDDDIPVATSSSQDALKVMEIIDKAYRNAKSAKEIDNEEHCYCR